MAVVVVTDRKNVNDKRAQLRGGGEREKNGPAGSAALRRESYTGGVYEQKKNAKRGNGPSRRALLFRPTVYKEGGVGGRYRHNIG